MTYEIMFPVCCNFISDCRITWDMPQTPVNQNQAKDLLRRWSIWLFGQDADNDTAADGNGGRVMNQNAGNDPWFMPGTWGRTMRPIRTIHVPAGTNLFIVAASSHATPNELPAGRPSTPANLKNHARAIHDLWFHAAIGVGPVHGPLQQLNLTEAETDVFQLKIDRGNGYADLTEVSGAGIDMVSIGRVALFQPPAGRSRIIVASQSPQDDGMGKNGEREYNVHVSYDVNVP